MAVISTFTQAGNEHFGTIVSGDAAPTDSILLELTAPTLPHSFLGIRTFDSSGDEIFAAADTGGFTITAALDCSRHLEALTDKGAGFHHELPSRYVTCIFHPLMEKE